MLSLGNNLDLVKKFQFFKLPHKTSNTQFHDQAIHSPKHFSYKPIPKIEVPKTRKAHSSTFRDPTQYSDHVLAKNFILLNFRLNEISVESKNVQIRFQTGKLWSSAVDAVDSQGCVKIWAHPRLPFYSGFCYPVTQCLVLDSPKTP